MNLIKLSKKYNLKEKNLEGIYGNYTFSIIIALSLRFIYVVHGTILVHWSSQKSNSYFLILSYSFLAAIAIEGSYVVFLRKGRESKYFSLCSFFYIVACVPAFWVLHYNRQPYICAKLINETSHRTTQYEITGMIQFNETDDEIFRFNETIFLAFIVLSRWFLPKDDLNRENSYALVISNLSMAADTHEIFFQTDNLNVFERRDEYFQSFMLYVWTISLPLFTINTTTESYGDKKFRQKSKRYLEIIFGNFYWKYITSMVLMDGPYFLVRIIGVVDYQIIGYQNLLYIFKNAIQMIVQIYCILGKIFLPENSDLFTQNKTLNLLKRKIVI